MDLIRSDIDFILKQIQFEFVGLTPVTPTASGERSNLVAPQDQFGAADNLLARESRETEPGTCGIAIGAQPRVSQSGVTFCEMLAAGPRDCVRTNR